MKRLKRKKWKMDCYVCFLYSDPPMIIKKENLKNHEGHKGKILRCRITEI